MAAIAKNSAFAKKVGIKPSIGEEFMKADKGRKFGKGGMAAESKKEMREEMKADVKQDKAIVKKAFAMHDKQEHKGGKGTDLSKLKKGGMAMKKMAKGGETMGPRNMSQDVEKGSNKLLKFGESAVQKRGHTKGKNLGDSGPTVSPKTIKMAKGGMCGGGKAMKRYDDGGKVEFATKQGANKMVDDDTRAKALEYANSRIEDEPMIDMRPAPKKAKAKPKAKSNAMTDSMSRMNPAGDTYKKGGKTASNRADGCCVRGKTKA